MKLNLFALVAASAFLAACSSSSDIAVGNPGYFGARLKDNTISGAYNQAGFSSAEVKKQVGGTLCASGALASYGEQANDKGLMAYTATCKGAANYSSAFAEFEKGADGKVMIDIIGS